METQSFIVLTYDEERDTFLHQVFTEVAGSLLVFLKERYSDGLTHFIHSLTHKPNGQYECNFTFHIDMEGRIVIH